MSRIRFKYINLNPFVVRVPTKRGILACFQPKQFSTDEWYSRFVGKKRLSRVPIAEGDDEAIDEAMGVVAENKDFPVPDPPEKVEMVVQEETEDYILKNGVYFCKKCSTFRSGKKRSLLRHLAVHHQIGGIPQKPDTQTATKTTEKPDEPTSEPEDEQAPDPTVQEPVPVPDNVEPPDPGPSKMFVNEGEEEVQEAMEVSSSGPSNTCPYCGRGFKSAHGVKIHVGSAHKDMQK